MNSLVKDKNIKAINVWFTDDMIFVRLEDGREIGTPLEWYPRLRNAPKSDLENWRFIGNGVGIHWETLDEDISVNGLFR